MISYVVLVTAVLAAAVALATLYVAVRPRFSSLRHLPSPSTGGHFLTGWVLDILREEAMEPQLRWAKEHPDAPLVWYRFMLNADRLLVTAPDLVKEILVKQEAEFTKTTNAYTFLKRMLGDGLVTQLGATHAQHRKLIAPAFKFGALKGMTDMMVEQSKVYAAELSRRLQEAENSPATQGGEGILEVAIGEDFNRLTLNIIGLAAFGFDFEAFHEGPEPSLGQVASRRFHRILVGTPQALTFAINMIPPLRHMPIASLEELKDNTAYTNALVGSMIDQKRSCDRSGEPSDLLEILVDARDEDSGAKLSDDDLIDHIKTFLFAGHETTSTLLAWTVYELSQAPAVMARIREELATVLGERDVTYGDLDKLVYLTAVLKEVLRKDPPVAMVSRKAEHDVLLGDVLVPQGTSVIISPYVLHHHPKLWRDPERYDPERWLAHDGVKEQFHPYQYLPFLLGPRNCIGSKFAMMEAKVILATLLKSHQFHMSREAYDATERTLKVTMRPKPSLSMKVTAAYSP